MTYHEAFLAKERVLRYLTDLGPNVFISVGLTKWDGPGACDYQITAEVCGIGSEVLPQRETETGIPIQYIIVSDPQLGKTHSVTSLADIVAETFARTVEAYRF